MAVNFSSSQRHSSDRRRAGDVLALFSCQPPASTIAAAANGAGTTSRPLRVRMQTDRAVRARPQPGRGRRRPHSAQACGTDAMTSCASAWSGNLALPARRLTPTARRLSMPWAQRSQNRKNESSAGSAARVDIRTWCSTTTATTPIGRTINRGESQSRPCAHALVVLKYSGPNDYYVLTSYPECR